MRRVMVIGGAGAGKSTVAREIGQRTGLPVVHMDQLFWEPGWVEASEQVFRARVSQAVAGAAWVMDGNYSRTWPERIERADTLVFLDLPTGLRLWRVLCRTVTSYGRTRPDLAEGCPEQFDPGFIFGWVTQYRRRARPKALTLLRDAPAHIVCHHLTSRSEIKHFLDALCGLRRPLG